RGAVQFVPNPRLMKRSGQSNIVSAGVAQTISDPTGDIELHLNANSFQQTAAITLTRVDGQSLPALLPVGWSPLNAFWFEGSVAMAQPINASVHVNSPATAVVRWNATTARWNVLQTFSSPQTNVLVTLPSFGAYALVVGDTIPVAPPTPLIGADLLPGVLPP